jgi:hypothetical protein
MRHIITLLLMLPLLADAQIYIDSYRFGVPVQAGLLLDSFPGAAAAYSLRKLDNDYTGNCIVVQRDNGDTSAIGFAGNFLDTAAMKTFCGTGAGDTCRVRIWYDQSGNSRFARMDTMRRQPLIMIDGAVVYQAGKPSLFFTGVFPSAGNTGSRLDINGGTMTNNIGAFTSFDVRRLSDSTTMLVSRWIYVLTVGGSEAARVLTGRGGTGQNRYTSGGRRLDADAFASTETAELHNRSAMIGTVIYNYQNTSVTQYRNGTQLSTNTSWLTSGNTSATNSQIQMIGNNGTFATPWAGNISELIFYESDQSTNRAAIENNINTFYSIY